MIAHPNPKALDNRPDAGGVLRFMRKISLDHESGNGRGPCWIWNGYVDRKGYGQFRWNRKTWWAHRIAYVIFNGSIPHGEEVNHLCANPSCVNPDHLNLMSKRDNVVDGNRRRSLDFDDEEPAPF